MVAQTLKVIRADGSEYGYCKIQDAYKLVFILSASSFLSATTDSFCFPSGIKGGKRKGGRKRFPRRRKLRSCQKVHSRESELLCIQSLKLSVFFKGVVMSIAWGNNML